MISNNVDAFIDHFLTFVNDYKELGYPPWDLSLIETHMKVHDMYVYFSSRNYDELKANMHEHYLQYNKIDQVTLSLFGIN